MIAFFYFLQTICYPLDFARTRLASDVGKGEGKYKGIADVIGTTFREQGTFIFAY